VKKTDETIIAALLSGKAGKKYEGKEVVVLKGKVYILPDDDEESRDLLNNLIAKHPNATPTLVDVPRPGIYILFTKL